MAIKNVNETSKPTPGAAPTHPEEPKPEVKTPNADAVDTGRDVAPTETVKQDLPEKDEAKEIKPQSYVHLSDGSVLRVNNEDLPGGSGAQNPHGHWQRGKKVYEIIGIYDVESNVE